MGMNPRLLRPRQTTHPEAAAWASRVRANGGSVSGTTLSAVDRFCKSIDAARIRDRFWRLNLFCGGTSGTAVGINSAMVPLYRGPSRTGTQHGLSVDDNVGGVFVGGDYNATGASGGLAGGGGRYLKTGFATNLLSEGNRHLSAYETVRSNATFDRFIGSEGPAFAGDTQFVLGYASSATQVNFGYGTGAGALNASAFSSGAHYVGVNTPSGFGEIYRNGVSDNSAAAAVPTPPSSEIFVFAINRASAPTDNYGGRLAGYSIGAAMDATQVAAYYAAMQAFQTAIGRNV